MSHVAHQQIQEDDATDQQQQNAASTESYQMHLRLTDKYASKFGFSQKSQDMQQTSMKSLTGANV